MSLVQNISNLHSMLGRNEQIFSCSENMVANLRSCFIYVWPILHYIVKLYICYTHNNFYFIKLFSPEIRKIEEKINRRFHRKKNDIASSYNIKSDNRHPKILCTYKYNRRTVTKLLTTFEPEHLTRSNFAIFFICHSRLSAPRFNLLARHGPNRKLNR